MRNPPLSEPQPHERLSALKMFGGNIRRERTARRMSQEKLALLAHLNVRTICKIEAGELNVRQATIERMQQALGCPMFKLLEPGGKDAPAGATLTSILKKLSGGM